MAILLDIAIIKMLFSEENYIVISTEYNNSKQKIKYKCSEGHIHSMRLDHWRRGIRCPYCSDNIKKSIEYIKPFFEKENYTLVSNKYKNANTKLHLICPKGHDYYTSWHNWSSGKHRCSKCHGGVSLAATKVDEIFNKNGYSVVGSYINCNTPVKCICTNGHEYQVTVGNFVSKKSRCTLCSGNGASSGEILIRDYIAGLGFKIKYNDRNLIAPLELDIVIPEKKLAIEYCGLYWHSELNGKSNKYHTNKLNLCEEIGYTLITIFEDELLFNKEIVFSRLSCLLGNSKNKIYARKCKVEVIPANIAKKFCVVNHLQGYGAGASIRLGAFYVDKLVSVMTFSKPSLAKGWRDTSDLIYELHRFCSIKDTVVVGIASKLFKHFIVNFKHKKIFSYADRRWSVGNIYSKLGFNFMGYTRPNYWYIKNKKRINRFSLRKNNKDDPTLTEWENRYLEGYDRIWDCGNIKYEYIKETKI